MQAPRGPFRDLLLAPPIGVWIPKPFKPSVVTGSTIREPAPHLHSCFLSVGQLRNASNEDLDTESVHEVVDEAEEREPQADDELEGQADGAFQGLADEDALEHPTRNDKRKRDSIHNREVREISPESVLELSPRVVRAVKRSRS